MALYPSGFFKGPLHPCSNFLESTVGWGPLQLAQVEALLGILGSKRIADSEELVLNALAAVPGRVVGMPPTWMLGGLRKSA